MKTYWIKDCYSADDRLYATILDSPGGEFRARRRFNRIKGEIMDRVTYAISGTTITADIVDGMTRLTPHRLNDEQILKSLAAKGLMTSRKPD
jgi:hypothetical protein